ERHEIWSLPCGAERVCERRKLTREQRARRIERTVVQECYTEVLLCLVNARTAGGEVSAVRVELMLCSRHLKPRSDAFLLPRLHEGELLLRDRHCALGDLHIALLQQDAQVRPRRVHQRLP